MTAAHCVLDESGNVEPLGGFSVYTGSNDWTTAPWVSGVAGISVYPDFAELTVGSTDYDIALIELVNATKAPTMPLATTSADGSLLSPGENVVQVGWGVTSTDPSAPINDSLQQANAVLQSTSTCTTADQVVSGNVFDSGDQLCTLPPPTTSQGTCSGDSGGPLVANNGGVWTEIGLTTYGTCDPSQPDYYTNVAAFGQWLHSQLEQMPLPAEWGTYRGKTSQGWRVTLKLSRSDDITEFNFGFTMRCTRGRHSYTFQPVGRGSTWPLNADYGVGFAHTLTDSTGTHYRFAGLFTSTGKVSGTLSATWRSPKYGYCQTGPVRWSGH